MQRLVRNQMRLKLDSYAVGSLGGGIMWYKKGLFDLHFRPNKIIWLIAE